MLAIRQTKFGKSRFVHCTLQPRNDFSHVPDVSLRPVAVHLIAELNINSAVPKPADLYTNFGVVDFLKFRVQHGRLNGVYLAPTVRSPNFPRFITSSLEV